MIRLDDDTDSIDYTLDERIYRDPFKITMLIEMIKHKLGFLTDRDIESPDCADLTGILSNTAINNLTRTDPGTSLLKIYFAKPKTIDPFVNFLGLGTWENLSLAMPNIIRGNPITYSAEPSAQERHRAYEIWYYEILSEIKQLLGISPKDGSYEIESENNREIARELREKYVLELEIKIDSKIPESHERTSQDVVVFHGKPPYILGEERKKAIEFWARYLINPQKPLAITGMAGIGKTTFARNLINAQDVVNAYGNFRFEISCEAKVSYEAFLSKIMEETETPIGQSNEKKDKLILTRLMSFKCKKLILFDNFDTCYDNYFYEAKEFLFKLQSLATIVYTIRTNAGPQRLDCIPFPLPKMKEEEAINLFSHESNNRFADSNENLNYIRYFVSDEATGFLPLAVKLLAHQARMVSRLSDLYAEWIKNRMELLEMDGPESDKDWNLTLSISFSYKSRRLKNEDRAVLKALCDFPSSLAYGRQVIGKGLSEGFRIVSNLVGTALIEEQANGELFIHPMIREFMRKQDIEATKYLAFLSDYFLDMAIKLGEKFIYNARRRLFFENWPNIDFVLHRHPDKERVIHALCMANQFSIYGRLSLEHILETAVETSRSKGWRLSEAKSLVALALCFRQSKDNLTAKRYLKMSAEIYSILGESEQEADTLFELASLYLEDNEHQEARLIYKYTLSLSLSISYRYGEGVSLMGVGLAKYNQGDREVANQDFLYALAIFQSIKDPNAERSSLYWLRLLAQDRGDIDSEEHFRMLAWQTVLQSAKEDVDISSNQMFYRGSVLNGSFSFGRPLEESDERWHY